MKSYDLLGDEIQRKGAFRISSVATGCQLAVNLEIFSQIKILGDKVLMVASI